MTDHRHLDLPLLLDFADGRRPDAELGGRAVAHLREVSPDADRLYRAFEARRERHRRTEAADYSGALAAAERRVAAAAERLEADRSGAEPALGRLLRKPAGRRLRAIERSLWRFRNPALAELLLERGRQALFADPRRTLHYAELAQAVALRVAETDYGEAFTRGLWLRCLGHRANALRVLGELPAADELWELIHSHLAAEPAGEPDLEAELASLEASLRQDQRLFEEAERLLGRAHRLWRAAGDRAGAARALIKLGMSRFNRGSPREALTELERAESLLGEGSDPLRLAARHGRAVCLVDLGRPAEAAQLVAESADLYRQVGGLGTRGPKTWLEARIAAVQGKAGVAEKYYLIARNQYLQADLPLDAALVALDLAELHAAAGRWPAVRQVVAATAEVFASRGVQPEAARALGLLAQAAAERRREPELAERLKGFLALARDNPSLRFEVPG